MIKKKKSTYFVYNTNIKTRQARHNLDYKKGIKKTLYDFLRLEGVEVIKLNPIIEYKEKIHSKRFEMYLLLINYFENDMKLTLKQRIPNISDLAR
jgi:hypothetical protein